MENSVDTQSQTDVLIIGAGPSGLSLGYHLQKLNINYQIVEQNDVAGSSWKKMPDHLHLISVWKSNYLLKEDLPLSHPYKAHSAKEFADYLAQFATRHKLNIQFNIPVNQIKKENGQFVIETKNGNFKAKLVVDCRGYFNYPFIPYYEMTGDLPFMIHFKDYKNRLQLNPYENILIVGKRLSAGQLICELALENRHKLFLSKRSHLHYSPPLFILKHFLRHLNVYEGIAKKFTKKIKREVEVPMHHTAKRIIEKSVTVMDDISKIEGKIVTFSDGKKEKIDAIIFATGFHPPQIQLKDDFESRETEGLFYLGRNTQRTFTSRFIRGIREDAEILGKLILGRLASSKRSQ